ncbi:MAG: hypothetical protein LWW86_03615 [Micrococcales bacterium]|nr:hypothetical protein [Micrococcales bacterium]
MTTQGNTPDQAQGSPRQEQFALRQKITMMVNRYVIAPIDPATGAEGAPLAIAQQKRMAFKEQVTFYADKARTRPVFSFKARRKLDLGAGYDVFDAEGRPIGYFKKDFGKSLLRSTWHISTPDGFNGTGQERNANVAVLRRVWEFIPVIGEMPLPFIFHFDFTGPDGRVVLSSERKMSLRDRYTITVPVLDDGWQLDWRVAMAMSVALDALQSR